jgi:hypothetical protein
MQQLQRSIGNRGVERLLRGQAVQPKLSIGSPGDAFEQEADRVADKVMRMPAPAVQRACSCSSGGSPCPTCDRKQEELVQRRVDSRGDSMNATVPDNFLDDLGSGEPLDSATRAFFEPRFGHDFGAVRIHTNSHAAESARSVSARAYTVGNEIVFGAGQYAPGGSSGMSLLAHELVHVVQQNPGPQVQRKCHACDEEDKQLRKSGSVLQRREGPVIQRQCSACREEEKKLRRSPSDDLPPTPLTLGPRSAEDCGDPSVPDAGLKCDGMSKNGPGEVASTGAGWELRNFDVDQHFIKPKHKEALTAIAPALKAFLDANPGKQIKLTGEASTTEGECYNMRLSRRRARCVARALEALGIPAVSLDVTWIGDRDSERRLARKTAPTATDIENPEDRRVRIELESVPQPECPPDVKLRASKVLDFRFGCLSRTSFSVVIADNTQMPIYREFVWDKLLPSRSDCEFFPELDPTDTINTSLNIPVRLAWTPDPLSPSDFSTMALQKSVPVGPDSEDVLALTGSGEEIFIDFAGIWNPSSCTDDLKAGKTLSTIGMLRPVGPVQCGRMPVPKTMGCAKPGKDDCSKDRRESRATRFKAKFETLSLKDKAVEWLGDQLDGYEVRFLQIGTIKTDAEKKTTGDDIWRPFLFTGKVTSAPEGCEQRDSMDDARGEVTTSDPEQLDGINLRPARLVRVANSNVVNLWIGGVGTFKLTSDECSSGGAETLYGTVEAYGGVRCERLEMKKPPGEETCKDDCPEARRTCADTEFLFRFGRMDPANAPPAIQKVMLQTGCEAQAARVNIATISKKPIWRPFYWVQLASCPFTVRKADLGGAAGKVTVGVKPKFRFKWPPIGVDKVFETDGLRLATRDANDPAAPTEFPSSTKLGPFWLRGGATSSAVGVSGATTTRYEMAVGGSPVDWTGSCQSSDRGVLVPAGKVECGMAPEPAHDPAPADTCASGILTHAKNLTFFALNRVLLSSLGSTAGIIQSVTHADGRPRYKLGEVVKDARFIGQVFGPRGLEPVVVVFDMKVLAITELPGRIDVLFTVLSRPCAYLMNGERLPLRLFEYSCAESIRQGVTYKMGNDLPSLPPPKRP